MSKSLVRSQPYNLLTRILEEPRLVEAVQTLPPRTLGKLINHVGLEDSGELVALATTQQLKGVFDEDLWHSERPGKDEEFDASRFFLWLEVMLEAGTAYTAQKLTELDEDLVTLALCKHILVVNVDELASHMAETGRSDEDDLTDKALESCLYQEFEELQVISRDGRTWETIVLVLAELDKDHHEYLRRLLERCCYISTELIEDNGGLYQVLTSEDMLEADVAGEREDWREQEGFVSPSGAASFLALARVTPLDKLEAGLAPDPVTRRYFRTFMPEGPPAPDKAKGQGKAKGKGKVSNGTAGSGGQGGAGPSQTGALEDLLRQAELLPSEQQPRLLSGAQALPDGPESLFERGMRQAGRDDVALYSTRIKEVSYLANVLISGCSRGGSAIRAFEATEAAVAVCNLGLEHMLKKAGHEQSPSSRQIGAVLTTEDAVKLFQIGWHRIHREVAMQAALVLAQLLTGLAKRPRGKKAAESDDLGSLAAALKAAVDAGKPHLCRSKLPLLEGFLPPEVVSALRALTDELPTLPATAGQETSVALHQSPHPGTQIQFIATEAHIQTIRSFLDHLAEGR